MVHWLRSNSAMCSFIPQTLAEHLVGSFHREALGKQSCLRPCSCHEDITI